MKGKDKNKFIQNIITEENRAVINLYDEISYYEGEYFSNDLRYLATQVENIEIRINSLGGNVMACFGIFSTMRDLISKGTNIETYNDGVAASCAGWLLQAGKVRNAADFSLFMLHDPYGENADDAVIQAFKGSIVKILASNSNMTEDQVSEMMSRNNGNGVWLDASQQLENGFVDNVFEASTVVRDVANELKGFINGNVSLNQVKNVANKLYNKESRVSNKKDMTKINSLLNLQPEASEGAQVDAIKDLINKANANKDLATELATAKSQISELENKLKDVQQSKAIELVENAVSAGKIDEAQKESWLSMANADFEAASIALGSIKVVENHLDATKLVKKEAPKGSTETQIENDLAKQYEDLTKNNPKELQNILESDPEQYTAMLKAYKESK